MSNLRWNQERVMALRTALNMTQEELANSIGVSFTTVSRWETGRTKPRGLSVAALDRLAIMAERMDSFRAS